METDPRIARLLVEKKVYTDLEKPAILTSGQLGIFYLNTEKLADMPNDPVSDVLDEYKTKKDCSFVINDAIRRTIEDTEFNEVISILSKRVQQYIEKTESHAQYINPGEEKIEWVISGGETRDWVFSGPVASNLGLPHISIYKDGEVTVFIDKEELHTGIESLSSHMNVRAIHVPDLLTEASSCYRLENRLEKGWIPELRKRGIRINDLVSVVSRLQGGERNLAHQGVYADSLVQINPDFLRRYSTQPDEAVAYLRNPEEWTQNYLRKNGATSLVSFFSPEAIKKDNRAEKFLNRYGELLRESGNLQALDTKLNDKYGKGVFEIFDYNE